MPFEVEAKTWEKVCEEGASRTLTEKYTPGSDEAVYFRTTFTASTAYCLKVRVVSKGVSTQWSDEVEFTPEFRELCVWKKCPDDVCEKMKYCVDENNHRVATKISNWKYCTIIGSVSLPLNTMSSWSVKILKSKWNNEGSSIYVGVAPLDIDQKEDSNHKKCGWYFYYHSSTLWSGPPYNYSWIEYGPRKENGKYVHTGDSVGVVMDTVKRELSFILNGVNPGVAYEGIPLDKPLVPCVLL